MRAPTTVGTSAAHLAVRPILHPVLAWPLRARGSFTLRALLRHLLFPTLRVLDFAILVEGHSHARPPNHRHPSSRPEECSARQLPVIQNFSAEGSLLSVLFRAGLLTRFSRPTATHRRQLTPRRTRSSPFRVSFLCSHVMVSARSSLPPDIARASSRPLASFSARSDATRR